ncbi:MAG TPA: hypothetical protein VGK21_17855 [Candidatus Angelobacter sp.]|jgi:hypothetical protein
MSETVFIFGAGFSAPAGMPVQADIMSNVLRRKSQDVVRATYQTLFSMVDPDEMEGIPLEDVFTMLDRARHSGETIRGLNHTQIRNSYDALIKAVAHEFNRRLMNFDPLPYASFFSALVSRRLGTGSQREQAADPFAILTLNWDTIPDFMIAKSAANSDVAVDYACYDYDLEAASGHLPSILKKAKGKFNIKLLKLHGSLNWLVCTCCGRLFSQRQEGGRPLVAMPETEECRFCKGVALENLIITPSLVKDIGQTHLKMVWHNALMDLQEAKRLVFVGYSFPQADFEFRYILLKAITSHDDLRIRVVLYPPDILCVTEQQKWQRDEVENRYTNFFGQRDIDFKFLDAQNFMLDPSLIWDW